MDEFRRTQDNLKRKDFSTIVWERKMTNLIQWQPQSADKRGDLGIYGKVVKEGGGGVYRKEGD